jgi:hypothetical protein
MCLHAVDVDQTPLGPLDDVGWVSTKRRSSSARRDERRSRSNVRAI